MAIEIRAATAADAPVLLELIRALAEYEKLLDEVTATEEALRETLFGERRHAEALIAWEDGQALGFALYFHNYSTFLAKPGIYLEDLFVRPQCRGRGLGRRLLSAVAAIAVERGCGRFEWAVLDWNAPAIAFYERLGARPLKEWIIHRVSGEALRALAAQG